MNTPNVATTDELFEIERQIARRADELARKHGVDPRQSLHPWRLAEQEVWSRQQDTCHAAAAESRGGTRERFIPARSQKLTLSALR